MNVKLDFSLFLIFFLLFLGCSESEGNIYLDALFIEEHEEILVDCLGGPSGDAVTDECGICDSDSSNDCIQDCAGIWGGTSIEDECGVCGGGGFPCPTVTDIDGNFYTIIQIGDQKWTQQNLKVTHYNNGDEIPKVIPTSTWKNLTSGAFSDYSPRYYYSNETSDCVNDDSTSDLFDDTCSSWYDSLGSCGDYDDDDFIATELCCECGGGFSIDEIVTIYGRLYNWYAVDDERDLCPEGWHVPSDDEWTILTDYLGGESVAGGKMKETGTDYWKSPNMDATNESGFTGLPSGIHETGLECTGSNGQYSSINNSTIFWTSDSYLNYTCSWARSLSFNGSELYQRKEDFQNGLSIRCLKD